MHLFSILVVFLALLAGCTQKTAVVEDLNTRTVRLPDRTKIRAEVMLRESDMMKGMKYRDNLEPDRGMLFFHAQEGTYPYWMYEVKIPLDIIWMDRSRRIVEVFRKAEPCPGPKEKCPVYGGKERSLYVLELAGGMVDRYGLKVGQTLDF